MGKVLALLFVEQPACRLAPGMTMMVVTHEMGLARQVAKRVVFMDEGEIVEDATTVDFFDKPRSEPAQAFLSNIVAH